MHPRPAEVGGRLRFADIRLVVGTRPEAIKLAPVADALAARGLAPTIVLTGQHDVDPAAYGLSAGQVVRLHCCGQADPHRHVQAVTRALLPLLRRPVPDLVVVQGDTSSALGGALAGVSAGVPVAHVEAGLRTHDPERPWPEEEYRTAIDAEADLLFAPTDLAAANLAAEAVPGKVHVTGNSGIDALLRCEAGLPPPRLHDSGGPRLLVTCHRRESWGSGLESIAAALLALAAEGAARIDLLLHPNRHVSEAMCALIGGRVGINLVDPCSHAELVQRMRECDLILSDSGGMQEEAPALGVPLLVLREITERPEAIATGNMRLVGTDCAAILAAVRPLLNDPVARAAMARRAFPYGDGTAAPRIAEIIDRWLMERSSVSRRLA